MFGENMFYFFSVIISYNSDTSTCSAIDNLISVDKLTSRLSLFQIALTVS
jgi:hypothetical protein